MKPMFSVFQLILFYMQSDEARMLRQSDDNSQRSDWHSISSLQRVDSSVYVI